MKIYREVGTLKLITQCDKEGYVRPVYEIEVDEAEAEPIKHGHWIERNFWRECSVCGSHQLAINFNYCPNCGAKMEKETE